MWNVFLPFLGWTAFGIVLYLAFWLLRGIYRAATGAPKWFAPLDEIYVHFIAASMTLPWIGQFLCLCGNMEGCISVPTSVGQDSSSLVKWQIGHGLAIFLCWIGQLWLLSRFKKERK